MWTLYVGGKESHLLLLLCNLIISHEMIIVEVNSIFVLIKTITFHPYSEPQLMLTHPVAVNSSAVLQ